MTSRPVELDERQVGFLRTMVRVGYRRHLREAGKLELKTGHDFDPSKLHQRTDLYESCYRALGGNPDGIQLDADQREMRERLLAAARGSVPRP